MEWYPAPSCYGMKKGHFGDNECGKERLHEKKGKVKKYKGKYEQGVTEFEGSGKGITVEAADPTLSGKTVSLTCTSSILAGELLEKDRASEVITYSGCKLGSTGSTMCASGEVHGQIVTSKVEAYDLEDSDGHAVAVMVGKPIMTFECEGSGRRFELTGSVAGRVGSSDVNVMLTKSEAKFGQGSGEENVQVRDETGRSSTATFTEAQPMTFEYKEPMELYFAPPAPPK